MDKLLIKEHNSVGLIKFGMPMDEAVTCMELYQNMYQSITAPIFCEYDAEGNVCSIHLIIDLLKEHVHCTFKGMDLLNTKATKLVEHFDHLSPYNRNEEATLGYTYTFPRLGLSFWRGNVCTENEVEADWFKKLSPDIQADNKRFLYFETVTFQCH